MSLEDLHEQETAREVSEASEIDDKDVKKVTFPETEEATKEAQNKQNNLNNNWSPDEPPQNWSDGKTTQEKYQDIDNWQHINIEYKDIEQRDVLIKPEDPRKPVPSVINIRNLDSNESIIPESEKSKIIEKINNLSNFEKIIIVWCTDWTPINTEQSKNYNQSQFEKIREKYIQAWWTCPTLHELLSDDVDPQNKILWYRRAMEWALSLNLDQNQMKKIWIDAKLWKNINDPSERGFDINMDYTKISEEIIWEMWEIIQKIYWNYVNQDFVPAWVEGNYKYVLRTTNFSTDVENFRTQLYKKFLWDLWDSVEAADIEKKAFIDNEVKKYLNVAQFLIPYYDSANWLTHKSETIDRKDYYLIKLSKELSKEEFTKVLEWSSDALNIIWNKTLKDQKDEQWNPITVNDFVKNNNINAVDHSCSWDTHPYHYKNWDSHNRVWRRLSKEDYILLGMYFELKKGQ